MTRDPSLSKSARFIQENKARATSEMLRQFRYIYWIDRREKKSCLLEQKTPPKHYADIGKQKAKKRKATL